MKTLLVLILAAMVSACGGGDPEDECTPGTPTHETREMPQYRIQCNH